TRLFGLLGSAIEGYVVAPRMLGSTRRPAINSRGRNREHKFAVAARIAIQDCLPTFMFIECHYEAFRFFEYRMGCHGDQDKEVRLLQLSESCPQSIFVR